MSERLEISLTAANNKPVSLKSMSPEALESFITVMSSLKSLATSSIFIDEMTFSISEGSARGAVASAPESMQTMYSDLELAMDGESLDKSITDPLRKIQEQIKRENYNYRFIYKRPNKRNIAIHPILKSANRITVKRTKRDFDYQLRIVNGFLNQIGGKIPNYHFDYGDGDKITIDCSIEDANHIKSYLYKDVQSLLICKEYKDSEKKTEYYHRSVIEPELVPSFKKYLKNYRKCSDMVKKLTITYDFVDTTFEQFPVLGHSLLKHLLKGFNNKALHISELKTMLVISKPFKNHSDIKVAREALLQTYQKIKWNV